MRLAEHVISFSNEFSKFTNTVARMLDSIYHMTFNFFEVSFFVLQKFKILTLCLLHCYGRYDIMLQNM